MLYSLIACGAPTCLSSNAIRRIWSIEKHVTSFQIHLSPKMIRNALKKKPFHSNEKKPFAEIFLSINCWKMADIHLKICVHSFVVLYMFDVHIWDCAFNAEWEAIQVRWWLNYYYELHRIWMKSLTIHSIRIQSILFSCIVSLKLKN